MPLFGCCIRKVVDVKSLDYRHSGLNQVPSAVFNAERSLEELHIDSNQIKVLPRVCHGLNRHTKPYIHSFSQKDIEYSKRFYDDFHCLVITIFYN